MTKNYPLRGSGTLPETPPKPSFSPLAGHQESRNRCNHEMVGICQPNQEISSGSEA